MIACYTDRYTARPGETVMLHASASHGPCTLRIDRVGRERHTVWTLADIAVGDHPTPPDADRAGCRWPVATGIEIGADWASGYYDVQLTDARGEVAHHFVCVKPAVDAPRARLAIVLTTNTYLAYNWWGGANAYSNVTALMTGQASFDDAMGQAIGVLSTQRPFVPLIVSAPDDIPRLVNMRKRAFQEQPWAADPEWMRDHAFSPYDGSAGFLNKWEHRFVEWAETAGYTLDYFTDYDLEVEEVLSGYAGVLFVGHSEYWGIGERAQVERYVDAGGRIAILSGNTCFWRVRFEDDGATMINHKWRGLEAEPEGSAAPITHLWSLPEIGEPEAALTGLSFLFGGYHRLGLCAARGQGGYTIYNDRHWALEGTDLFYGDVIGDALPLIGYESDGCRFDFGDDGLPRAIPQLGVPANLEIIGVAPCAFGEEADRGYAPVIPPERLAVCARVTYGDDSEASQLRMLRGHAVIASFRRGTGEVFNTGTTEWAHGLAAGDPFIDRITRNVLDRFSA
ncbi:hypothetical protein NS334_00195 [Sphingomonas endophytica]|uniref:N,N-dimethylformamidase beta subunit-like C-terminal domain-containing protein n=2 Tax=Sphingomonas endophytica TaxID=869719 RepID=A0A147I9Z9_9SPHN|nr:hypothetical protein NS334_00195 [Sphingomonas endophytica]